MIGPRNPQPTDRQLHAPLLAAGASDEESSAREAATSLGEAIYQRLVG